MKRSQILLLAAGLILVAILFFVLLFQPSRERVDEVEAQIATEESQQASLRADIAVLRAARDEAPELEAELAAAEAIIPRDPALPSAIRQLQQASNDSGLILSSISTARPVPVLEGPEGLATISVSVQMEGGYFQLVDFLRRVEDPLLTPRGLTWSNLNVAPAEYPGLNVALTGELYTVMVGPPPPDVAIGDEVPEDGTSPDVDDPNDDANSDDQDDVEDVS